MAVQPPSREVFADQESQYSELNRPSVFNWHVGAGSKVRLRGSRDSPHSLLQAVVLVIAELSAHEVQVGSRMVEGVKRGG